MKSSISTSSESLSKAHIISTLLPFLIGALLMWSQTHYTIPFLHELLGYESIILWFIVGGCGIFVPLLIIAFFILKTEGLNINSKVWKERMRFKKINSGDIIWSVGGVIISAVLMGGLMTGIDFFVDKLDYTPTFMEFEPLDEGRYWILGAWSIFWISNIMGEEILWRGTMQPFQERLFGKKTWIVQGIGWSLFHVAFGWQLWLMLLPLMFVQPYVVQKRGNSWCGVLIHGLINGPSFVAIALGLI